MKFFLQKSKLVRYQAILLFSIVLSQVFIVSSMADDLVNITEIEDCRRIGGDAERLTCYDTVINGGVFNEQKLRQVQVEEFGSETMPKDLEPAKPVAPVEQPAPKAAPAETKTAAPATASATVKSVSTDELNVTIVRVKKGPGGIYYFQTSEGQVWKQQNATRWSLEVPFDAKIEKGMMGSFFLVNEGGKSTRVKRVK